MRPNEAVVAAAVAIVFYMVLVFLVSYVGRTLEFKLIALGLLTGVLAMWLSQVAGTEGMSTQVGPGQPGGVGIAVGAAEPAGALGRIAVLLVLGGIGLLFWNRWATPAVPARPEEGIRADRL
jgi:hypothetical protein